MDEAPDNEEKKPQCAHGWTSLTCTLCRREAQNVLLERLCVAVERMAEAAECANRL